jgi:holo-[acyl-carrier protein] synthase
MSTPEPGERILGHGVDLVEIARIAALAERHGERFLQRCFCPEELALAEGRKRQFEHLAGRFAAKEAILKALGTGWRGGIAWTDMNLRREPSGAPRLELTGETAAIAEKLGIHRWLVSMSHTETHAIASAIAVG